jgi:hypothetical protein
MATFLGALVSSGLAAVLHLPDGQRSGLPWSLAAVRREFNERTWIRWNLARAVLSTVAFACLLWALAEHGRDL